MDQHWSSKSHRDSTETETETEVGNADVRVTLLVCVMSSKKWSDWSHDHFAQVVQEI